MPNKKRKVVCVLRKSHEYSVEDVNRLAKQVKKNLTLDHEFVAIVDTTEGLNLDVIDRVEKLKYNYDSWWCKMELFRRDIFRPDDKILYFDLDTIIADNIDFMFNHRYSFIGLKDFYRLQNFASGVMFWIGRSGYHLLEGFKKDSTRTMKRLRREGDQRFIRDNLEQYSFWQDIFPERIVSYKVHIVKTREKVIPKGAKVICFHGKPKIAQCNNQNILNIINK